ncbi:hypothetical protein STA3757_27310 [Stanieria sp. NIES-3757]|nr:hypothetical protein STA3757_27310 [Stanieria sp. NIES-3757]
MIAPLIKLDAIGKVSQFSLVFRLKVILTAFLIIGSGFIGASVIAETESENSSDTFSEPIRVDVQEEKNGTEVQPRIPSNISSESKENNPSQIGDIIEVNPRSEQWEDIHSGDLSSGTIKFRLNR